MDGLLRGSIHNHQGTFYEVSEAGCCPGCVQQPRVPLAIAAGGSRSLRVAAQYGDAWITYGDTRYEDVSAAGTERTVADQAQRLADFCAEIDRDVAEIDRIFLIGNNEARPLASLAAFEDFAGRYAALGFTDLVFHMPRTDDPVWTEDPGIVELIAEAFLRQGP